MEASLRRKRVWVPSSIVIVLAAGFVLGPRVDVDTAIDSVALPADLDAYLEETEARFANELVPNTEKIIQWAGAPGERTPYSVVYLHGFSATRQETAPLSDRVAAAIGANLFYTRFTGHGLPGEYLAEATVNDWLNDTWEAFDIGRRLGDQVIVLGTSTGGTAAAWLAAQPDTDALAATVLISPNLGPVDTSSEILTWPWGRQIAQAIVGPEREWVPENDLQALYWTERYPTPALLPMMGLVKLTRGSNLEGVESPLLVLSSPDDLVADPERTRDAFERWGGRPKDLVEVNEPQDPSAHVLAGDILAPGDTPRVEAAILEFIRALDG
jgi:esterase/lipase